MNKSSPQLVGNVNNFPASSWECMTNGQKLRVVGQIIDLLKLTDFTIEVEGHDYLVSGERVSGSAGLKAFIPWAKTETERTECRLVELRCTPEIVERMEKEGQNKRRVFNLAPPPLSSSEVLRNVGNYLDLQRATLIRLSKESYVVTARVQTPSGTATVKRILHRAHDRSIRAPLSGMSRSSWRETLDAAARN